MDNIKILIIDDEADIRESISDTLKYEPYELLFASNGQVGLDCIVQHSPVVVLLDLRMPVMDGIEVLTKLNIQPDDPYTVIVLTGHADDSDVQNCYELGIHAFLRKPFNIFELQGIVKNSIELKLTQRVVKAHLDELNVTIDKLDVANEVKGQFLMRMSHELRTPLNAIIGFSQLQDLSFDKTISAEMKENQNYILQAGNHLLKLINGILDFDDIKKTEKIDVDFPQQQINLDAVIEASLACVKEQAAAKYISLAYQQTGIKAKANFQQLQRVLVVILKNAIIYNLDYGRVTINVRVLEPGKVEVSIEDNGIGIESKEQPLIFEPFTRLPYATQNEIGGIGIGLALSKYLIENMNGSIGFDPAPEQGTVFWLRLPQ